MKSPRIERMKRIARIRSTFFSSLCLCVSVVSFLFLSLSACSKTAPVPLPAQRPSDTFLSFAPTPPMGWNSWDVYGPSITEAEARANAEVMARDLLPHGWQYFVIDIRWYVENETTGQYNKKDPKFSLDEYGRLTPAVNRFPSAANGAGFKPLADYLHSLGLKFGIHIMRGVPIAAVERNLPVLGSTAHAADITNRENTSWIPDMYTVLDQPGGQAYYDSIFALYAAWGVDFVKVDNLSSPYHAPEVEMIRRAIDRCGRPIVFSTSPGATPLAAAEHVGMHANMWRMSGDFWDNWIALRHQFDLCRKWAPHQRPGNWPDADMLPLGRFVRPEVGQARGTNFTRDEQVTMLTLWSIFRSPLMLGADLTQLDDFTRGLLTNDEVLAVNQTGSVPRELFLRLGQAAWMSDAPGGGKFVALFNLSGGIGKADVAVKFSDLGLTGPCRVRDLWAHQDLGEFAGSFSRQLPGHGAGMFKIESGSR